jgi:cyclophilin family peptidyl-prolyl cis-trans isomerase
MTWTRRAAAPAAAFAALALPLAPLAGQVVTDYVPATDTAVLAERDGATEVGTLIFRGGVEIAPDTQRIGGISGLAWHGEKLHAVTDEGRWMVITPEEIGERLVNVAAMDIGPLRDLRGAKLSGKTRGDAEALTRLASGDWLVAFEQEHRVWRYGDLAAAAAGSDDRAAALLAGAAPNSGIEALAAWPGGLLACGEWVDPARPNCLRIAEGTADPAPFHLAAPEGIAEAGGVPSDAACRADGTCYVLMRSYVEGEGNRAAILALAPDGTATTLAVLAPPMKLDNFEGLAVREEPGRTFLYLVSDDNTDNNCANAERPGCQRTLLMKFEIAPPPGAAAAPLAPADFAVAATARPATRPRPEAASVTVVLETALGPVTIALETGLAPITAGNFLRYVEEGRLAGTSFYRAMDLPGARQPSGLVQGGTRGDPRRIRPPIAHEPTDATGLSHVHGAVAMAMDAPGTADGDFFIMIEDQTGFDADPAASDPAWRPGFAVFGHVVEGMDVIAAIHSAPRDPNAGEGVMKGQMLAEPVKILRARRAAP